MVVEILCEARRQIRSIVDLCEEFGVRRLRAKFTHQNDFLGLNTKVTKCVIKRRLLVGRLLALSDNQRTSHIELTCRELLCIGAWNNHRASRNIALVGYRLIACNIDNMCLAGNYRIRADNLCGGIKTNNGQLCGF